MTVLFEAMLLTDILKFLSMSKIMAYDWPKGQRLYRRHGTGDCLLQALSARRSMTNVPARNALQLHMWHDCKFIVDVWRLQLYNMNAAEVFLAAPLSPIS